MSLSRLTLLVLLTLVPFACNYATASPTFTYEANLTTVFSSLSYGDLQAASSDTNLGTFHLSLYQAPSTRLNTSYVSLAVAAAPLCLASHGSGLTDVTLSELASILLGTKNVSFRVVLGSTKVSPASHQLLLSLNDRGVTGFESTEEWPASVLSNTNIVWVHSDAELSTYISRKTAVIGPQASMLASAASVACVRIRLTSSSGDNVAFSQQPTSTTIEHVVLNNAMTRVSTQGGVYPFMGALVLTVPIQTSCADLDNLRGLLTYLFSNANVSSVFAGRNIVSFDNVDQYRMLSNLRDLVSSSCTSTGLAFAAYGDMSVYDVIANTALAYGSTPSYSTYAGGANATVLFQSLAAGDISVAVVDSPSVSQFTPYASTLLIAPVFAQSMAFVYNLDGYDALSASACTMYGLLNGSIAWWDDTMVLNDNVGLTVPHVRVTPLVTNSSSTRSVLAGVNLLYQMCFGSASTPFDVNGGWPFANATDYTYIDAYSTVGTTYGSFAFVPTPTATDRGLTLMPLQLSSGAQLAASASTTASIIQSKAIVDSTTNVAALSLQGSIYPFVSIIHIAVRATYTSNTANCSDISAMLKFFQYLSGGQGNSVASGLGYTIVADAWRMTQQYTTLATHLAKVTCDGTTVLSSGTGSNMMQQQPPQTSSSANLLGPVIGSVFGVLVLVAALVALKILRTRSHSTAPKDEAEPFAIVFTDVQSSTALWANAPLEMGPALEQHHALMRQAIAATGGYEVKTIGDSFMVAYRDAKDAVQFGLMAQRLFHDAEWSNVFDEFYRDEVNGKDDVTAAVIAQYDSAAYGSLWRGLRVRIGVHYGHGQIKLDPVTQAYDYYGTVVNTAARVEAVGHGGQVCVTAAAAEAAGLPTGGAPVPREEGSIDPVSIKDLGPQELYGLSEAVRLYQVLPQELGARLFPPLRARHGSDNDDDDEQGKDGVSDHSSASGASNVDDDVGSYLDKAAVRLDPKMSGDTLFLFYRFFRAMSKIASATGGEKKSSAQGQNNPIHRLLELWGVTGAPINNLERRLLFATSPSTLHSCRFVVRIATAMRSQRRGKPTVGMSPSRSDDEVHGKHHGVSDHGNSSCTESPTSTLVLADDKKPTFPGTVGAE